MGKSSSKLTPREIKELADTTYFDKKEILQWHKDFLHDCPDGVLKKEAFRRIYQQFFPRGDASRFSDIVFGVFDTNQDGLICFREFLVALSVTSRGTLEEKLDWAFTLYDRDGDGFVTEAEMTYIVDAIYCMLGDLLDLPQDEDTAEKRVTKIFAQMDTDGDGMLCKYEFMEGAKNDPWIVQALAIQVPGCSAPHRRPAPRPSTSQPV